MFLKNNQQFLIYMKITMWASDNLMKSILTPLLTNSKEKKSVFTFRIQNILSKALQLQGHKGRCVHFGTCVKNFIFNASCELHRPAFMTLEPIR